MSFIPSKGIAISKRRAVALHLLFLYISTLYKDGLGQIQRLFSVWENCIGSNRYCIAGLYKSLCLIIICRLCAIVETSGVAVELRSYKINLTLTENELFCR